MTSSEKSQNIIWIDCEMTGLSISDDALVEIGVLVTDSELNILGDGVDVVIKASDLQLAKMSDFVRKMHTDSGLLAEIPSGRGDRP
jgi:oligoribonuclease